MEEEYRKHNNLEPLIGPELDFSRPFDPAHQQWLDLLVDGSFPVPDPSAEPVGYEVDEKWLPLLEDHVRSAPGNWYAWLHIGLIHFYRQATDYAEKSWLESIGAAENPWAYRNLAQLALLQDDACTSVAYYEKAFSIIQDCFPLTVEFGTALLKAGTPERWLEVYKDLSELMRRNGRIQLLFAQALLDCDRLDEAKSVIEKGPQVNDLREGENSLTDLWYRIHERIIAGRGEKLPPQKNIRSYVEERFPPPAHIDFRMKTKPAGQ